MPTTPATPGATAPILRDLGALSSAVDPGGSPLPAGLGARVLVAFTARWCLPWRLVAKGLEEFGPSGPLVIEVDVDKYPRIADDWGAVALPTVVLVEDGVEKRRVVGAVGPGEMAAMGEAPAAKRGMRRRR